MKNEVFSKGQTMAKWDQRAWEFAAESHARWSKFLTSSSEVARFYAEKRVSELEAKYPQLKPNEST